jgi:hypothetical protein
VLTISDCARVGSGYGRRVLATAGLRAYYRLGERSGATACDLAGARNGSYGGAVSLGEPGAPAGDPDTSAVFAGAGWMRVAAGSALSSARALSLEAWLRPDLLTVRETLLSKDGEYVLRVDGGRVAWLVSTSTGRRELVSLPVLASGVFQHIVAVYDGDALRIYVDGRQVAARSASGRIRTTAHPLYVGSTQGRYEFLRGGLDEVAIYRRGLSAKDVARHHAAGVTPPPTRSDVSCGYGGFRAHQWPDGCWRPYGAASPFNQPLPSSPRLAADSAQVVARLLHFGPIDHLVAGNADTPDDFGHPTYYSEPTDPLFELHCLESSWGRCPIEGMRIRVPDPARPAAGADGHLTVVDQASGWEYDLYDVRSKPPGGGTLEFRWGGRTRIDGDGLGSGATAAQFGSLAGIIRAPELAAGHIDHALFMVARCDAGRAVYPAAKSGYSCAGLGLPTGDAPPMGARLQLAMSPDQIDALPVPAWKKTILRAMSEYGLILGDTGGGSWGVQAESGSTYTSFGVADPLVEFAVANGWTRYAGDYVGNLRAGVNWARYLRVIDPCVSERTC